jgi:hypothetical protein
MGSLLFELSRNNAALSVTWRAQQLIEWVTTGAYQLTSAVYNTPGALISGSVVWPDGNIGVFTTDVFSTAFQGAIDAYHVTYVLNARTYVITQAQITRDGNGDILTRPLLVVA